MKEVEELMAEYHIDAFFAGHQHLLQHLQVKYQKFNSQIDYFVNGAAGMHVNHIVNHNHPHNVWAQPTHGFMLHFVTSTESRYDMIDSKGKLIYQHKKFKI
jgi:hypothetical protein